MYSHSGKSETRKSQLGNVSPMPIVANLSTQTTEMKVKTMVNLTLIIFYLTFEFVQVPALAIKVFVVDVT